MRSGYDAEFYASQSEGSRRSAEAIVPIVQRLIEPSSVVDVGCGVGTWLSVWREAGVEEILGIDGSYVDRSSLRIDQEAFMSADLTKPPKIARRFDLAMSVEVAEHLDESYAESFVDFLASLSEVVLFSAAVPLQTGVQHVNEQWQSYWSSKFADRGFVTYDPVRPAVWEVRSVEWFYAQNTLLYARAGVDLPIPAAGGPIDIVHPRAWERPLGLNRVLREAPGAVQRALRRRIP